MSESLDAISGSEKENIKNAQEFCTDIFIHYNQLLFEPLFSEHLHNFALIVNKSTPDNDLKGPQSFFQFLNSALDHNTKAAILDYIEISEDIAGGLSESVEMSLESVTFEVRLSIMMQNQTLMQYLSEKDKKTIRDLQGRNLDLHLLEFLNEVFMVEYVFVNLGIQTHILDAILKTRENALKARNRGLADQIISASDYKLGKEVSSILLSQITLLEKLKTEIFDRFKIEAFLRGIDMNSFKDEEYFPIFSRFMESIAKEQSKELESYKKDKKTFPIKKSPIELGLAPIPYAIYKLMTDCFKRSGFYNMIKFTKGD